MSGSLSLKKQNKRNLQDLGRLSLLRGPGLSNSAGPPMRAPSARPLVPLPPPFMWAPIAPQKNTPIPLTIITFYQVKAQNYFFYQFYEYLKNKA